MQSASLTYDEIEVGLSRSFRRLITDSDIDLFGKLTGDVSPLHTDNSYSNQETPYGERLVHGMLLASLVSCLVGMHLPGFRSVCLSQQFDFAAPVYAGDEVEVRGEVVRKTDSTRTIQLRTEILGPGGKLCVRGKAVVQVLDSKLPDTNRSSSE